MSLHLYFSGGGESAPPVDLLSPLQLAVSVVYFPAIGTSSTIGATVDNTAFSAVIANNRYAATAVDTRYGTIVEDNRYGMIVL